MQARHERLQQAQRQEVEDETRRKHEAIQQALAVVGEDTLSGQNSEVDLRSFVEQHQDDQQVGSGTSNATDSDPSSNSTSGSRTPPAGGDSPTTVSVLRERLRQGHAATVAASGEAVATPRPSFLHAAPTFAAVFKKARQPGGRVIWNGLKRKPVEPTGDGSASDNTSDGRWSPGGDSSAAADDGTESASSGFDPNVESMLLAVTNEGRGEPWVTAKIHTAASYQHQYLPAVPVFVPNTANLQRTLTNVTGAKEASALLNAHGFESHLTPGSTLPPPRTTVLRFHGSNIPFLSPVRNQQGAAATRTAAFGEASVSPAPRSSGGELSPRESPEPSADGSSGSESDSSASSDSMSDGSEGFDEFNDELRGVQAIRRPLSSTGTSPSSPRPVPTRMSTAAGMSSSRLTRGDDSSSVAPTRLGHRSASRASRGATSTRVSKSRAMTASTPLTDELGMIPSRDGAASNGVDAEVQRVGMRSTSPRPASTSIKPDQCISSMSDPFVGEPRVRSTLGVASLHSRSPLGTPTPVPTPLPDIDDAGKPPRPRSGRMRPATLQPADRRPHSAAAGARQTATAKSRSLTAQPGSIPSGGIVGVHVEARTNPSSSSISQMGESAGSPRNSAENPWYHQRAATAVDLTGIRTSSKAPSATTLSAGQGGGQFGTPSRRAAKSAGPVERRSRKPRASPLLRWDSGDDVGGSGADADGCVVDSATFFITETPEGAHSDSGGQAYRSRSARAPRRRRRKSLSPRARRRRHRRKSDSHRPAARRSPLKQAGPVEELSLLEVEGEAQKPRQEERVVHPRQQRSVSVGSHVWPTAPMDTESERAGIEWLSSRVQQLSTTAVGQQDASAITIQGEARPPPLQQQTPPALAPVRGVAKATGRGGSSRPTQSHIARAKSTPPVWTSAQAESTAPRLSVTTSMPACQRPPTQDSMRAIASVTPMALDGDSAKRPDQATRSPASVDGARSVSPHPSLHATAPHERGVGERGVTPAERGPSRLSLRLDLPPQPAARLATTETPAAVKDVFVEHKRGLVGALPASSVPCAPPLRPHPDAIPAQSPTKKERDREAARLKAVQLHRKAYGSSPPPTASSLATVTVPAREAAREAASRTDGDSISVSGSVSVSHPRPTPPLRHVARSASPRADHARRRPDTQSNSPRASVARHRHTSNSSPTARSRRRRAATASPSQAGWHDNGLGGVRPASDSIHFSYRSQTQTGVRESPVVSSESPVPPPPNKWSKAARQEALRELRNVGDVSRVSPGLGVRVAAPVPEADDEDDGGEPSARLEDEATMPQPTNDGTIRVRRSERRVKKWGGRVPVRPVRPPVFNVPPQMTPVRKPGGTSRLAQAYKKSVEGMRERASSPREPGLHLGLPSFHEDEAEGSALTYTFPDPLFGPLPNLSAMTSSLGDTSNKERDGEGVAGFARQHLVTPDSAVEVSKRVQPWLYAGPDRRTLPETERQGTAWEPQGIPTVVMLGDGLHAWPSMLDGGMSAETSASVVNTSGVLSAPLSSAALQHMRDVLLGRTDAFASLWGSELPSLDDSTTVTRDAMIVQSVKPVPVPPAQPVVVSVPPTRRRKLASSDQAALRAQSSVSGSRTPWPRTDSAASSAPVAAFHPSPRVVQPVRPATSGTAVALAPGGGLFLSLRVGETGGEHVALPVSVTPRSAHPSAQAANISTASLAPSFDTSSHLDELAKGVAATSTVSDSLLSSAAASARGFRTGRRSPAPTAKVDAGREAMPEYKPTRRNSIVKPPKKRVRHVPFARPRVYRTAASVASAAPQAAQLRFAPEPVLQGRGKVQRRHTRPPVSVPKTPVYVRRSKPPRGGPVAVSAPWTRAAGVGSGDSYI